MTEICNWCDYPIKESDQYWQTCVCQEWWHQHNSTLMSIQCRNKNITDEYYPSPLFVSTITGVLNVYYYDNPKDTKNIINLKNLSQAYNSVKYSPDTKSTKVREYTTRGNAKQNFFNQATFEIDIDSRTVSTMIFSNGKIKIAGARHPLDCIRAAKSILSLLKDSKTSSVQHPEKIVMSQIEIHLINTNLHAGFFINQNILNEDLQKSEFVKSSVLNFEKKYHAINCKIYIDKEKTKTATILIFHKGSIIITAIKNILDAVPAYNFITNTLYNNMEKYKISDDMIIF